MREPISLTPAGEGVRVYIEQPFLLIVSAILVSSYSSEDDPSELNALLGKVGAPPLASAVDEMDPLAMFEAEMAADELRKVIDAKRQLDLGDMLNTLQESGTVLDEVLDKDRAWAWLRSINAGYTATRARALAGGLGTSQYHEDDTADDLENNVHAQLMAFLVMQMTDALTGEIDLEDYLS